jgi:hypothetical protein
MKGLGVPARSQTPSTKTDSPLDAGSCPAGPVRRQAHPLCSHTREHCVPGKHRAAFQMVQALPVPCGFSRLAKDCWAAGWLRRNRAAAGCVGSCRRRCAVASSVLWRGPTPDTRASRPGPGGRRADLLSPGQGQALPSSAQRVALHARGLRPRRVRSRLANAASPVWPAPCEERGRTRCSARKRYLTSA